MAVLHVLRRPRTALILGALFAGGFVPIHVVVLSFGYAQYVRGTPPGPRVMQVAHEFAEPYVLFLYLPAMIALVLIMAYSRTHYPSLYRRLAVGLAAGAIATIGLDWIRQMGVLNGWLPADTAEMFGKAITGSNDFATFYWVGQAAHFMNGADFGLCFTLLFGRFSSRGRTVGVAVLWMLLMELGMMVGPPMGPMVGLFGVNWQWPQLFALTFVAHVVHGIILGLLAHRWLRPEDGDWIVPYIKRGANIALSAKDAAVSPAQAR